MHEYENNFPEILKQNLILHLKNRVFKTILTKWGTPSSSQRRISSKAAASFPRTSTRSRITKECGMSTSVYKSSEGRDIVEAAYRVHLSSGLAAGLTQRMVDTTCGRTFVIRKPLPENRRWYCSTGLPQTAPYGSESSPSMRGISASIAWTSPGSRD